MLLLLLAVAAAALRGRQPRLRPVPPLCAAAAGPVVGQGLRWLQLLFCGDGGCSLLGRLLAVAVAAAVAAGGA